LSEDSFIRHLFTLHILLFFLYADNFQLKLWKQFNKIKRIEIFSFSTVEICWLIMKKRTKK